MTSTAQRCCRQRASRLKCVIVDPPAASTANSIRRPSGLVVWVSRPAAYAAQATKHPATTSYS
jgi:hypothetical protein